MFRYKPIQERAPNKHVYFQASEVTFLYELYHYCLFFSYQFIYNTQNLGAVYTIESEIFTFLTGAN